MRKCFLLLFIIFLNSCDIHTESYDTKEAAIDDELFERGWLPELIPNSATKIVIRTDGEANLADGTFHYSPSEHEDFVKKLSEYKGGLSPVPRWDGEVSEVTGENAKSYYYSRGAKVWVFICKDKSFARFMLWSKR